MSVRESDAITDSPIDKCRTMELELVKSCDGFLVYFSVLNRMGRNLSPGTSTLASSRRKNEAAQAPKDD